MTTVPVAPGEATAPECKHDVVISLPGIAISTLATHFRHNLLHFVGHPCHDWSKMMDNDTAKTFSNFLH